MIERLKLRSKMSMLELSQQGRPSKRRRHNMVRAGDDAAQFPFWIVWCGIPYADSKRCCDLLERTRAREAGSVALGQFSQR